jgi:hypothetical protein
VRPARPFREEVLTPRRSGPERRGAVFGIRPQSSSGTICGTTSADNATFIPFRQGGCVITFLHPDVHELTGSVQGHWTETGILTLDVCTGRGFFRAADGRLAAGEIGCGAGGAGGDLERHRPVSYARAPRFTRRLVPVPASAKAPPPGRRRTSAVRPLGPPATACTAGCGRSAARCGLRPGGRCCGGEAGWPLRRAMPLPTGRFSLTGARGGWMIPGIG